MSQSFTGGSDCLSDLCKMSAEEAKTFDGDVDCRCGYDMETPYSHTALHTACKEADLEKIKVLLELGADPNARTSNFDDSETPLHKLVGSYVLSTSVYDEGLNDYPETHLRDCILLLIEAGADVNAGTLGREPHSEVQKYTSLHVIATSDPKGWRQACDLLLDNGADLTARTSGGLTAMELGAEVSPEGYAHAYLETEVSKRGVEIAPRVAIKILHAMTPYAETLNVTHFLKPLGFDLETTEGNLGPQFMNRAIIYEAKNAVTVDKIYDALEPLEFRKYYSPVEVGGTPEGAIIIFMR